MSEDKYIVSIDEGTSSSRALLIDMQARIVDIRQKEFTQYFPRSGWVEHDAEEIWTCQLQCLENLLDDNEIKAGQIAGIGITNQRETTVVWQKSTGKALAPAIVWQDRRTASICEELKKGALADYIPMQTGLVIDAYFSGTKLKWLLDKDESLRELASKNDLCFGTIDSWLIFKMTGGDKHLTDYTNASRTLLYNIKTLEWDKKILDALDIPDSILPEVQSSSSDFGKFNFRGSDIPICGVAGDQQSALFGQACFEEGEAKNTYGTGCFMLMNTGNRFTRSTKGLLTTLCCDRHGKVAYALEGSIFVAGAAIQWLRDGLKLIDNSAQTEEMAERVKDSNDLVVVPAFTGLGAPYWNMYARGAIFGITRSTSSDELAKATLDSLAYQTRDVLDAMKSDSGLDLKCLKVDGGAVANNYLMQFQSDILNAPVERPVVTETTALGAAYLAGLHLGIWDYKTILENRKLDRVFNPVIDKLKADMLYAQWQKAVSRTLNWLDKDE